MREGSGELLSISTDPCMAAFLPLVLTAVSANNLKKHCAVMTLLFVVIGVSCFKYVVL